MLSKEIHDGLCMTGAWVLCGMVLIGVIVIVIPWIWDKTSLFRYFIGERIRLEIALMWIRKFEAICYKAERLERKYVNAVRYLDSRPWNRRY